MPCKIIVCEHPEAEPEKRFEVRFREHQDPVQFAGNRLEAIGKLVEANGSITQVTIEDEVEI